MNEPNISIYLRTFRIRVFVEALRKIGKPARFCFLLSRDGSKLVIAPYSKRDLKSHAVPQIVYQGARGLQVNSHRLWRVLARRLDWDMSRSYRIPGEVLPEKQIVVFDLLKAAVIDRQDEEANSQLYKATYQLLA